MDEERPLPDPSDSGADALKKKSRLSYRAWLWLQHHTDSEYSPLARFVLSGGPENVFVNKPLKSSAVAFDLSQMYAVGQGRPALTSRIVHLANRAVVAYRECDQTVEDLMVQRQAEEVRASQFINQVEREALVESLDGSGLEIVTHRTGEHRTPLMGEGGLVRVRCSYINRYGKGCGRQAVTGMDRCDMHGALYLDPEQIKEMISKGQEKIVTASDAAIEAVLDLMQNSTQDAIRLKAAEMILDRAGFRPGMEITIKDQNSGDGAQSPADVLRERIDRLRPQNPLPPPPSGGQIIREDGTEVA